MNINLTFSWIILIILVWQRRRSFRSTAVRHRKKKYRFFPRTRSFIELNRNLIQMTDKKTDRREMDHGPTSEQHFRFKFLINFSEIGDGDTFFCFEFSLHSRSVRRLTVSSVEVGKKLYCQTLICWHADHYVNICNNNYYYYYYCCSQYLFLFRFFLASIGFWRRTNHCWSRVLYSSH